MKEFRWMDHSEVDCQKAFWSYVTKGVYEDETNNILDKPYYEENICHGTDGIYGGVLFEFKKKFDHNQTIEKAFGEAISYLRKFNNNGLIKIPKWIVIASFIKKDYWVIDAEQYSKYIYDDKMPCLGSSSDAIRFDSRCDGTWDNPKKLIEKVKSNDFLKTRINMKNFNNLNDKFYELTNDVNSDPKYFIRELKKCKILNWVEPIDIIDMQNIIAAKWDHVGGPKSRKNRGAFFTPKEDSKRIQNYLKESVSKLKKENIPYLIIDRCAGSGNLEDGLPSDILANTILNTYEFCEWVCLGYKFQKKVKLIIPPYTNAKLQDIYKNDNVMNDGDALSEKFHNFILNHIEDWRKKNPNGKILFLENPPFSNAGAGGIESNGKNRKKIKSFIEQKLKIGSKGNELHNLFVKSCWDYYLKNNDEYFLIGPIKYWKSNHIMDGEFVKGFISNRKLYNSNSNTGVLIIHWIKKDIINDQIACEDGTIIKKIHKNINTLLEDDAESEKICTILDCSTIPSFKNGYLGNNPNKHAKYYNLTLKNLLKNLPIFCANQYLTKTFKESEIVMKSADLGYKYFLDKEFLNDCLLWTLLTDKNRCITNERNTNELCYSGKAYLTLFNLDIYKSTKKINRVNNLISQWKNILEIIKESDRYNHKYKYGLFQIEKEISVKEIGYKDKFGKDHLEEWNNGLLSSKIQFFKKDLAKFYDDYIKEKLFEYELLK